MKREELQSWIARFQGIHNFRECEVYDMSEADKVMDAMEARIKELEAEVIGYKASLERANFKMCEKDARIKELECDKAYLENDKQVCAECLRLKKLEAENARLKSFCDRLVKDCKWLYTDRTPDKHGFETMVLCTNGKKRVAKFRMFDLRWYDVNNGDRLNVVKWLWQPSMPPTEDSSVNEKDG